MATKPVLHFNETKHEALSTVMIAFTLVQNILRANTGNVAVL